MDIEKFSECCLAKVCRDDEGHVRLTMCCVLKDPDTGKKVVRKKEVNLDGLISYAHKALMKYHQGLHGADQQVSGEWNDLLNNAYQAARRMGEARLVKALFSEVSPELGSNAKGPDDEESEMHRQAHEVLARAREGDRTSLDIMSALMNSAYRGNERALEILTLMRDMHHAMEGKEAVAHVQSSGYHCSGMTTPQLVALGSWWSSLKKAVKKVGKVATAPLWVPALMSYKLARGDFRGAMGTARGAVSDTVDLTKDVAKIATAPIWAPVQAVSNVLSPGGGSDGAPPPTLLPPGTSDDGPGYGQDPGQDPDQGQGQDQGQDQSQGDSQDDSQEFAGPQAEVSGWMFNKGYRTVAETVTSKFPGIGVTMRELYHRGNDSNQALAIVPIEPVAVATVTPASTLVTASGTYIVGLSWGSLMRKAKSLAHTVSSTASAVEHSDIYKLASPVLARVAPLVASVIPGGGMAYQAAMQAHDLLVQAKKDHPEAIQAIATIRKWADGGDQPSLQVAAVMQQMSNRLDEKAASLPPVPATVPIATPATMAMVRVPTYTVPTKFSQVQYTRYIPSSDNGYYHRGLRHRWLDKHVRHVRNQPQVSGWFYNKPYRGVLEAPGAMLAMRELYNRGEGHNPTTLGDVLRQVFPLGT
jgi:hypothetical protein